MKTKLKVGDRVSFEHLENRRVVLRYGWISDIDSTSGAIIVSDERDPGSCNWKSVVTPRQCRKLRKRDQLYFNKQTMDIALEPQDACGWIRYVKAKNQ